MLFKTILDPCAVLHAPLIRRKTDAPEVVKMDLPFWNHPGYESVDVTLLVVLVASTAFLLGPVF